MYKKNKSYFSGFFLILLLLSLSACDVTDSGIDITVNWDRPCTQPVLSVELDTQQQLQAVRNHSDCERSQFILEPVRNAERD